MKKLVFLGAIFVCIATIQGLAQSSNQNLPPDQHSRVQAPTSSSQQNQPMQRMNLSTFSGRIVKDSDGRYFLMEANSELKYLLDDQQQAAKYFHKPVIIEGALVQPGTEPYCTSRKLSTFAESASSYPHPGLWTPAHNNEPTTFFIIERFRSLAEAA